MPKKLFEIGNTVAKGKGRPEGSGFRNELVRAVGKDRFIELVNAIYARAVAGDMQAAQILVNRLVPSLKPRGEPQSFAMPEGDALAQARAVLAGVAGGELTVEDGNGLLSALAAVAKIQEVADIIPRLEAIERGNLK